MLIHDKHEYVISVRAKQLPEAYLRYTHLNLHLNVIKLLETLSKYRYVHATPNPHYGWNLHGNNYSYEDMKRFWGNYAWTNYNNVGGDLW